jgi:hypothetical protein
VNFVSLPDFKRPDAVSYPFVRAGGNVTSVDFRDDDLIVVACDRVFESAIGAPCGGPAEDALMAARAAEEGISLPALVDRFDASPRTSISIYAPAESP